jgi:hypothetical protein
MQVICGTWQGATFAGSFEIGRWIQLRGGTADFFRWFALFVPSGGSLDPRQAGL